jgi:hypothetical protein
MMMKLFFIVAAVFLFGTSLSRSETWERADINFVDWDLLIRTRITPENVRDLAGFRCTVQREAPGIARALDLDNLHFSQDKRPEDARLVIDLYSKAGLQVTYYASRFNLSTSDSTSKRPIDEQFRQHFRTLVGNPSK